MLNKIIDKAKESFNYVRHDSLDESSHINVINIGLTPDNCVLIRINIDRISKEVQFGVYDKERRDHIICKDFDSLKHIVMKMIKKKQSEEFEKQKDILKADLNAMRFCGFLSQNSLTYTSVKMDKYIAIHIFGTIFDELHVDLYTDGTFKTVFPPSKMNESKMKEFILMCKRIKELP